MMRGALFISTYVIANEVKQSPFVTNGDCFFAYAPRNGQKNALRLRRRAKGKRLKEQRVTF